MTLDAILNYAIKAVAVFTLLAGFIVALVALFVFKPVYRALLVTAILSVLACGLILYDHTFSGAALFCASYIAIGKRALATADKAITDVMLERQSARERRRAE